MMVEFQISDNELEKAAEILNTQLSHWPEDAELLRQFGRVLQLQGQDERELATVMQKQQNAERAGEEIEDLTELIQRGQANLRQHVRLGTLLMEHQSRKEGLPHLAAGPAIGLKESAGPRHDGSLLQFNWSAGACSDAHVVGRGDSTLRDGLTG